MRNVIILAGAFLAAACNAETPKPTSPTADRSGNTTSDTADTTTDAISDSTPTGGQTDTAVATSSYAGIARVSYGGTAIVDATAGSWSGDLTWEAAGLYTGNLCRLSWQGSDLSSSSFTGPLPTTDPSTCAYDGVACTFAFDVAFTGRTEAPGSDCTPFDAAPLDQEFALGLGVVEGVVFARVGPNTPLVGDLLMYWVDATAPGGTEVRAWYPVYYSVLASLYYSSPTDARWPGPYVLLRRLLPALTDAAPTPIPATSRSPTSASEGPMP